MTSTAKLMTDYMARVKVPPGWVLNKTPGMPAACWDKARVYQRVIVSIDLYDGEPWLHVSVSDRRRIPSYNLLTYVKRNWIGEDLRAIMVLPEQSKHVNIHPRCLHLFAFLGQGEHPLPEFSVECPVFGRQI